MHAIKPTTSTIEFRARWKASEKRLLAMAPRRFLRIIPYSSSASTNKGASGSDKLGLEISFFLQSLRLGFLLVIVVLFSGVGLWANEGARVINSLGMELVRIEPGVFTMGSEEGEWNEVPRHEVEISTFFYVSATQVTNEQYEPFDPEHGKLRGKHGFSKEDDEAVVFVSWREAVAFCRWLSEKEGIPYRLPTEAEWEYAARGGTTTAFHTGADLPPVYHRNQVGAWEGLAKPVPLPVGRTPPNPWGLYDVHGLVEDWVSDWYGPYTAERKVDPVGRSVGDVKVTRGGSHGTPVAYLRAATRLGTLPEDRSRVIGFRVVQAEFPDSTPLPPEAPRSWAQGGTQQGYGWEVKTDEPYFEGPIWFVNIAPNSNGPLFSHHNHKPAVTWLDNGDLFVTWFTTRTEAGREMNAAASRFRAATGDWTRADVFLEAPGRNQTGASLFNNREGTLYWFGGLGAVQGWRHNLALIMRTSTDNGATWSDSKVVNPERNDPERVNQPIDAIDSVLDSGFADDGQVIVYSDTNRMRGGGSALTFIDLENETVEFSKGTIAGIHARAVKLGDGRRLAVGRSLGGGSDWNAAQLPLSVSDDGGDTWRSVASEFPPIGGGQRLVFMRLREGPLLLVSFTNNSRQDLTRALAFIDENGAPFEGVGMYGAVSYDEGRTWPLRKLLTPADDKTYYGEGWTGNFTATSTFAEPAGYLTATQTPDGVIHLLSSGLHYRFNLKWLESRSRIQ